MKPACLAVKAAGWTLLHLYLAVLQVQATGVFELHLKSFRNDHGVNADGNCCNGYSSGGQCTSQCHTFFHVCLTHFQTDIASKSSPGCTFGQHTSKVVAHNSANLSVSSSSSDLPAVDNPIRFPFVNFSWPGDFSLIIEAWHDNTLTGPSPGSPRELISRLAVPRSAAAGRDWYNSNYTTRYTQLLYSYRFVCDDYYYGPACTVLCRARDDHFGHYYCSGNGTKVCRTGWTGEYCDEAICLAGCHPDHGYCDTPFNCSCRQGWEGRYCNECTPHPQCQHGTCNVKPYECNCLEGWGGLLCNQDLNFCTHHAPCQNGGTCTNTGQGTYTCLCRPGYSGANCEERIDHCLDEPCLNGATCQNTETGYTCNCPPGYYGEICAQEAHFCREETCHNGGTCVDHEGSYQCLCPQGYEGFHCQRETGGCKQDSCKNGGHCVSGECICPSGFSGPTCEDDGHDYCAMQPCLNGGTCTDLTNDFKCRCVAGFVGPTCEVNVDDCEMRPCANGGSCTDLVNDFLCHCRPGWIGKDCSINEDDCQSQPCRHGGVCLDLIDDYECKCKEGFWGKDCQMYEGMTTPVHPTRPASSSSSSSSNLTHHHHPPTTTEDPDHRSGNISGQAADRGSGEGDKATEVLLGVCLGVGIPIVALIVCAVLLLCRKLRRRQRSPEEGNHDKERQQNYLNNISALNKASDREGAGAKRLDDSDGEGGGSTVAPGARAEAEGKMEAGDRSSSPIFTTSGLHTSAVGTSSPASFGGAAAAAAAAATSKVKVKVSNEEQQDINRLSSKQHRAAHGGKTATKHFIRDRLGAHEPPATPHHQAPTPLPTIPSHHRDYSRVHDFEKPVRRLEVDPSSGDTQVDISTYRRHSGDNISILGKSNMAPVAGRDSMRRSVFLEPMNSRRSSHFTEDYLATEV